MIDVRKIPNEEFNNCNCCGKYNTQPLFSKIDEKFITKENIYEYTIYYGNGGMIVRLCKDCAKKLIEELTKQMGEKDE